MKKIFLGFVLLIIFAFGCEYIEPLPEDGMSEEGITYVNISELIEEDEESEVVETIIIDEEEAVEVGEEKAEEGAVKEIPTLKVLEGETVSFPNLKATDPDGDIIIYTFSSPLDDNGEWQTEEGDAGEYTVMITASDGTTEISQEVRVIVEMLNKAPVLEKIADITVSEGETLKLSPKALDPEGEPITITYSGWMTSDTKEIDYNEAGEYIVRVSVSDGEKETHQDVKITVEDVNRAPVFNVII